VPRRRITGVVRAVAGPGQGGEPGGGADRVGGGPGDGLAVAVPGERVPVAPGRDLEATDKTP
jgi:hypothetical protein